MATITLMPLLVSGSGGEIAGLVDQKWGESYNLLQKSNTLGLIAKGTFQQLNEVFEECSSAGWDGENARPISIEVLQCAYAFLKYLPLGIESPEVGAEPDGAITLEWYHSPTRVISISIHPGGWVYYAALIGTKKRHGMDFMNVSEDLIGLISQVTQDN